LRLCVLSLYVPAHKSAVTKNLYKTALSIILKAENIGYLHCVRVVKKLMLMADAAALIPYVLVVCTRLKGVERLCYDVDKSNSF